MNQPVDSPMIVDVAAKAIDQLRTRNEDPALSLVKIRSAKTQVVAGTKYYLEMDVQTKNGPKTVNVVVFEDLQGNYSLSNVDGL